MLRNTVVWNKLEGWLSQSPKQGDPMTAVPMRKVPCSAALRFCWLCGGAGTGCKCTRSTLPPWAERMIQFQHSLICSDRWNHCFQLGHKYHPHCVGFEQVNTPFVSKGTLTLSRRVKEGSEMGSRPFSYHHWCALVLAVQLCRSPHTLLPRQMKDTSASQHH